MLCSPICEEAAAKAVVLVSAVVSHLDYQTKCQAAKVVVLVSVVVSHLDNQTKFQDNIRYWSCMIAQSGAHRHQLLTLQLFDQRSAMIGCR